MKRTAVVAILGLAVLGTSLASAATLPERAALPAISMDPVNFAWALDPDQSLEAPTPFVASSRQYRLAVDAKELRAGVELSLSSSGAILRINPAASSAAVDPASIRLTTATGLDLSAGAGIESLVDAAAMKSTGAPFVEGTSAVRIAAEVRGSATLTADASDGRWVVSVFEPDSAVHLDASASSRSYFAGQTARATVSLSGAEALHLDTLDGSLVTPSGEARPATLERLDERTWQIQATLAEADLLPGALWEFHLSSVGRAGDLDIRRDVSTAFAVAADTARLAAAPVGRLTAESVTIQAPVDAAVSGRYEARAVIWGTTAEGALRPAAMVHSARFLPSGHGEIVLTVERDVLTTHGLTAPWEVRGVQLLDQGRMGLLQELTEPLILD